ncbi:MAG: hypothetical protein IJ228_07370 [Succinivibrio sp.]|nr:hypothetical protein [Succinivibrio sp.]
MTLPAKLPNPSKCRRGESFTEEEWEQYFEYRKNDRPMATDDQIELINRANKAYLSGDKETWHRLSVMVPLRADVAMASKAVIGLKAIQGYNLYEAKQRYPDEF